MTMASNSYCNMKLSTKIYTCDKRPELLTNLQNQLNLKDKDIYHDDRPNGGNAYYTAKKAWLAPLEEGETHRLVFPDDMLVCNNFYENLYQIVEQHPDKIISLFTLTQGREKKWVENFTSPYIYARGIAGLGIVVPVQYINPMFNWIESCYTNEIDKIADDGAINSWAIRNRIPAISTIPSLVQHMGDDSLEQPGRPIRKTCFFEENPNVNWKNSKIEILRDPNFDPIAYDKKIKEKMNRRG